MTRSEQSDSSYFRNLLTDIRRIDHPAIPRYYSHGDEERITVTLSRIAEHHPALSDFALGIVRKELEAVGVVSNRLPALRDDDMPTSLVKDEIFQVDHDIAGPLQLLMGFHEDDPSYKPVLESYRIFSKLRWALALHEDERFPVWYSQMIRLYSAEVIVPTLNQAIINNSSERCYTLYEMRSAFRELAGTSSVEFAQRFDVRSEVARFIADNPIEEKRSQKPVRAVIDSSSDLTVYMDKGDLYRMLRNLLRDAVTHSEGEEITPHITVTGQPDHAALCVLSSGTLPEDVLAVIGKRPYSITKEPQHGYGKVGAARLLKAMLRAMGFSEERIDELFQHHWANVTYQGAPHVRWYAPVPIG